jgi:ribosomal protein S18 acetylase RimI-like enzyme
MKPTIIKRKRRTLDLRLATPQDADRIAGLASAFRNHLERATPTDAQFRTSVAALLESGDAEFYLAEADGQPMAYVLQRFRYSMWVAGLDATIEDLFVTPEHRRKGIGKALIQFALDRARGRECLSVGLDTNENNAASNRIYTGLGFNAFSSRWQGRQLFLRVNLPVSKE